MRRRCLGKHPGGFLLGLASLDLDEGELLSFERHEIDLADRGSIALRHDAVAFEAKQECCQGLGKQPLR